MTDFTDALVEELARLEKRLAELQEEIALIDRVLERRRAAEKTDGRAPRRARTRSELRLSPDSIRGLSVEAAAIHIAEANDGQFRSVPGRRVMVEAGILPKGNTGSAILYKTMTESPRFERGSQKGVYNLIVVEEEEDEEVTGPTSLSPFRDVITRNHQRERIAV